ncbi:hypothetical protein [Pseudomonas mosselii]|uniref:hypothetical protein n=1 Tax=Pseudomonas mosselii TaxID=78327 RepID=UPI0021D91E44|nr:hypothetical protein [Pseudomonas mosselii]MCU9529353.1 hypothetical protein [Pseudomonas mosselii]MCU9536644.1 hypothetical protein [Pseudomonas mosselii]MCU9542264.1 hypothetical protein [Pseudomonas mosselii]MCU9548369.1 hypothetical protein [Pseudomonas mosselii]
MEHTQPVLNLNQAFHSYQALGVIRNLRPRARVCLQGQTTQIAKIILLADYQTIYWDPRLASAYAVAATFVLDGASLRTYQAIVDSAIRQHGANILERSQRAEMLALCKLIALDSSVCIQSDDAIVDHLSGCSAAFEFLGATLNSIKGRGLYSGREPIAGIKGAYTSDQICALVRETLAEGMTTFTHERLAQEAAVGEHENWRYEKLKAAA